MEILIETIKKIKKHCRTQNEDVEFYIKQLLTVTCKHVPFDTIEEACEVYKKRQCWDKPVVYLQAIILNLHREKEASALKELKSLGSLPPIPKNL